MVRWVGVNLAILAGCMAGGLLVCLAFRAAGWGDADEGEITYGWLLLYLPLTAALYLAALRFAARRVRRPRAWAVALTPLLFGLFPLALIAITLPGVAATWIAYAAFGALVRLPPAAHPDLGPVPAEVGS